MSSVQPTGDGGFIAAGGYYTIGAGLDGWILKTNGAGDLLWQRLYGGTLEDSLTEIQPVSGGGFIASGTTEDSSLGKAMFVVWMDGSGNVQWARRVEPSWGWGEGVFAVQQGDGNIMVVGSDGGWVARSFLYAKLSQGSGSLLLSRETTPSGSAYNTPNRAVQLASGDFALASYTDLGGTVSLFDPSGNPVWTKGSAGNSANGVIEVPGGGLLVVGRRYGASPGNGGDDGWAVRLDAGGGVLWEKYYGGVSQDGLNAAVPDGAGGFFLLGDTLSFPQDPSDTRLFLIHTDGNGQVAAYCGAVGSLSTLGLASATSGSNSVGSRSNSPSNILVSASAIAVTPVATDVCPTTCVAPTGATAPTAADLDVCLATGVRITWGAQPSDWGDGGLGTHTYTILRNGTAIPSGGCSGTFPYPTTTCDDTSGAPNITYNYAVRYSNGCSLTLDSPTVGGIDVVGGTLPTITGPSSNPCPSVTVSLSTETGMTNYQWYLNGGAIGGAVTNAYTASLSGSYTVSYTNGNGCSVTSAPKAVSIVVCYSDIRYDASYNPVASLVQVCGDGDGVVEPGEKWNVTVRLKNIGNLDAHSVVASLAVNAGSAATATITGNPAAYGTIAAGGGTATASYTFEVGTSVTCNSNLVFDVLGIASLEAPSYPAQVPAFTVQVGGNVTAQAEAADQSVTPVNASLSNATSDLAPAFTLASADSATLSYASGYTPLPATVTLFGADDFDTMTNWTGSWIQLYENKCAASNPVPSPYCCALSNGNAVTLASPVSTVGFTNIRVLFDGAGTQYGSPTGLSLDWSPDGVVWNNDAWTTTSDWLCDQSATLPAGAEGNPGFRIRFRNGALSFFAYARVDYVKIVGDRVSTGTWTANASVELLDPSATATVLKAFGAAETSPYDVKPYYTGPGTYRVRLTENLGGTASLSLAHLAAARNAVTNCTIASCTPHAPKEASPSGDMRAAAAAGTAVSVTFTSGCGATDHAAYWGSGPVTGSLSWSSAECGLGTSGAATFDPGPLAPGAWLYFVVVAQDATQEGSYGKDSSNQERPEANNAAWPCNKPLSLTGVCP